MRQIVVSWMSSGLVLGLAGSMLPTLAHAHSGGVSSDGCGCHSSGTVQMSAQANPSRIMPGQTVTVSVTIESPTANEAGMFLSASNGEIDTISGQGLAKIAAGLTHTQPKSLSGDQATFSFEWTAPSSPGAVRFSVGAVAANGNNGSSGDTYDTGDFDFVYGCNPQTFWRDFDGDGFGRTQQPLISCEGSMPDGYAIAPDDCDDNRPEVYPGATELCNQRDDDCDSEIDEGAVPVELYPDADGDGYYGKDEFEFGEMKVGCVGLQGFAAYPGDCRPADPEINPGVEEVCNGFDDDCDFDVDERVRPQCGEGWCRRESINCDEAACTPGEPREEECNFFDDDCDGVVDEDANCPDGESCQAGQCRPIVSGDEGGGEGGVDGGSGDQGAMDGTAGPGPGAGTSSAGQNDEDEAAGCGCGQSTGSTGVMIGLLGLGFGLRRRRGFIITSS